MTGIIATIPKFQFNASTGLALAGGTLTTYLAGTTTPEATYQDQALTIANANPIVLDSAGGCTIWLDDSKRYKFVLKNSAGTTQWTQDNINGATSLDQLLASSGSSAVGFIQAGTGAVATTVQTKLRESVSVKDFGAVGDGVTDDYAEIMLAHDSLPATGGEIIVPRGSYLHNSPIVFTKRIKLTGEGAGYLNAASPSEFVKGAGVSGIGVQLIGAGSSVFSMGFRGASGNTGDGVVIANGRITLEDVLVCGMGQDGIRIGNDVGPSNCNAWTLRNIRSKNNGRHGLMIDDKVLPTLPDANGGTLTGADIQSNTACGVYLGNNAVNTFTGLLVQQNGTYGVFSAAASQSNFFYGGDFEVNGRVPGPTTSYYDFYIEAGSKRNTIFGGSSYNDPQSFLCNDTENMIVGFRDGIYTNDDQYAGIQLFNVDSLKPTVLDWYEEGTFTPTISGETTGGVGTYTTQTGRYTRIGNSVRFSILVTWTAHTGTGNMFVGGLPFTAVAAAGFTPVDVSSSSLTKPADTYITAMVAGGTQSISLYSVSTSSTAATNTKLAIDAVATLYLSGTYEVA